MIEDRAALLDWTRKRVAEAIKVHGPTFAQSPIVAELQAQGVPRPTAYRLVKRALGGPMVARAAKIAAKQIDAGKPTKLAKPKADPRSRPQTIKAARQASEVARTIEVAEILPPVASVENGYTLGELIGKLRRSIEVTEAVLQHAHDTEGKIRMTKTALQASAQLRDSVLAYGRLLESATNATNMQAFVNAVVKLMEEVGRKHPAAGQQIALGLQSITAQWRV